MGGRGRESHWASDFNGDWNRALESNKRRLQLNHLSGKSTVIKIVIILFLQLKSLSMDRFGLLFRGQKSGISGPGTLDSSKLEFKITVEFLSLRYF